MNEPVRPVARLTDEHGAADLAGLFIMRADDPARTIGDLADHKIVFGPADEEERHSWALADSLAVRHNTGAALAGRPTCRDRLAGRRTAPGGCGGDFQLCPGPGGDQERGRRRGVPRNRPDSPQPFITVFVAGRMGPMTEQAITDALLSVQAHPPLLAALASKAGFVPLQDKPAPQKSRPPPPPHRPTGHRLAGPRRPRTRVDGLARSEPGRRQPGRPGATAHHREVPVEARLDRSRSFRSRRHRHPRGRRRQERAEGSRTSGGVSTPTRAKRCGRSSTPRRNKWSSRTPRAPRR